MYNKGETMEINITHLYAGADGESHFEDIKIPLEINLPASQRSETIKATGIIFQEFNTKEIEWHPAPRRQYIVVLEGMAEVEIGDGTKRILKPGDVVLAEDTTGRGHITRQLNNQPHKAIFITLD